MIYRCGEYKHRYYPDTLKTRIIFMVYRFKNKLKIALQSILSHINYVFNQTHTNAPNGAKTKDKPTKKRY